MSKLQMPVSEAWERAHKDVVNDPAAEKATYLLESIGPRITSAALGLADARQLKRWAAEDVEPREHAVGLRLDAVYWVVRSAHTGVLTCRGGAIPSFGEPPTRR